MIKTSASRLKAKMGKYMREVRAGREVLVTDRDEPVAKLVPVRPTRRDEGLRVARPRDPDAPPLGKLKVRGVSYRGTDTLGLLRGDRDKR